MADTVDLNEIEEYFDTEEELDEKCRRLAEMIRGARSTIAFTGAGISTSAGINDYRSPNGVWTCKAQGRKASRGIKMSRARPTFAHMALVSLLRAEQMSLIVSQNVDGLHRRSGVRAEEIAELHGNVYRETCWKCGAEQMQPFTVKARVNGSGKCRECLKRVPHFCHCTRQMCACGARMKDSIIHFKESLPEGELTKAFDAAEEADLCIVLGSSCRVTPAAAVPEEVAENGSLVIVNLQKTPLDDDATLLIRGRIDEVMERVMRELALGVEAWEDSAAAKEERKRVAQERERRRSAPKVTQRRRPTRSTRSRR